MVFPEKNTPRWIILILDSGMVLFSFLLAYLLRFNFEIPSSDLDILISFLPFYLLIRVTGFLFGKTYAGIIRYTSTEDAQRILVNIFLGSAFVSLLNLFGYFTRDLYFVPFSIVIIDFMTCSFLLIGSRISIKILYHELRSTPNIKNKVLIFGAGELGLITKRTIDKNISSGLKIMGFIDDDLKKKGKRLEGCNIYHSSQLDEILKENEIAEIIISINRPDIKNIREITDVCLQNDVPVYTVPPVRKWINGELSAGQIKKVKIENLLGRKEIQLNKSKIGSHLEGSVILISGAAGSIGSEIVRQVIPFKPKLVVLLDQAESPLYDLQMELINDFSFHNYEIVIGDVAHPERMEKVFATFGPDLVFHAAAYKHVPLMEINPSEAIETNVKGTKILADLANQYGVEEFVMISTDKAVNPTNVMGASKRIAEIYTQSLNEKSSTKFVTTRFGNVLGSNGSVIPLFRKQIEKGGPVTVTDPEITRYFMTIPEACQLVLEAGSMGKGGEIFVFDMGKSVKIVDLAKKMIKLSGLELGKDIQIHFTGLRPGEKLYEELLTNKENTLPTHHPQIMIGKVQEFEYEFVNYEIDLLISLFSSQDNETIVRQMKKLVPEYLSNNSEFEKLDVSTEI